MGGRVVCHDEVLELREPEPLEDSCVAVADVNAIVLALISISVFARLIQC
jgi:hypothetical protein